ncbi:MAG: WYL domain-containing protein [Candidatus Humimicrobiaceae bacterium]
MDIQTQVINAINSKCKVELNYKGEGDRIVCPHALYISSTGKTLVDSYQLSGYSMYNEQIPGWRPLDISKITEIRVLGEKFNLAPGYNPTSNKYLNVIAII